MSLAATAPQQFMRDKTPPPKHSPLWIIVLIAGCVIAVVLAPLPTESLAWQILATAVPVTVTIVMAVMSAKMPKDTRAIWWLFTAAQLSETLADAIYNYQVYWLGEEMDVGPADFFYFLSLFIAIAGLILLTHRLQPVSDLAAMIDTLILTFAGLSFVVMFTLGNIIEQGSEVDTFTLVTLGYPILDVAVLAAVVRLAFVAAHRSVSMILIGLSYAVMVVADVIYNSAIVEETFYFPLKWMESGYTLAAVIMLAAILAPGARTLGDRTAATKPTIGSRRVMWLTLGALTVPMILMYAIWIETNTAVIQLLAMLSFLVIAMVLWRVRTLLQLVENQSELLKQQARTDALTGLPNRRTLDFHMRRVSQDPDDLFTVAMLDIDHFKRYNDTHGHQKADDLLVTATKAWAELLHRPAFLARYGGEEFAAVIPTGFAMTPEELLEKARLSMPEGSSVSIGYATRFEGEDADDVLNRADMAMYQAKRSGRNRVVRFGDPTDEDEG